MTIRPLSCQAPERSRRNRAAHAVIAGSTSQVSAVEVMSTPLTTVASGRTARQSCLHR